jgi:hypothetical protein
MLLMVLGAATAPNSVPKRGAISGGAYAATVTAPEICAGDVIEMPASREDGDVSLVHDDAVKVPSGR